LVMRNLYISVFVAFIKFVLLYCQSQEMGIENYLMNQTLSPKAD